MRLTIRAAALLATLATLTLAQEAPDPFLAEKLLPPNALFHFSVPQSASLADDYAKSNVQKLWTHPEIVAFRTPIEKWWIKRKTLPLQAGGRAEPSFNDLLKAEIGLNIDEVWDLLQGPFSFTLYDVPVSEQHNLDLALTLGAADAGKLERAAAALKTHFREKMGAKDGEHDHAGTTVHEFGDDSFHLYYALIRRTLVVTTRPQRLEGMIDAAADPKLPVLKADPAYQAARARVSGDNRHFVLAYANLAQLFKSFRREIGDEALRAMETLGVSDITAIAFAMGYDGPYVRERYALLTARQDRGLVKLFAGGTPVDALAALVPASAISYAHFGFNLAEAYEIIHAASKVDPGFEKEFADMIGEYEARVGFKLKEAFASLGNSWSSWSCFPEGGGLFPDSILGISLQDPAVFEACLAKALVDGGLRLEDQSFRGTTIRSVAVSLDDLAGGLPFPSGAFRVGMTFSYYIHDRAIFLSSNPMSLKRQILRIGQKPAPIAQDPRYAALAARSGDQKGETWNYLDFGRVFAIVYGAIEPFGHLVRDLPRDEAGDLIVDLALLPLEQTVAELIGPTLTEKRTAPDAILMESRSNAGVSLSSSIALLSVGAGIAIPTLLGMRGGGHGPGGLAGNEMIAEVSLQFVRQAEETFKNSDSDGNGVADFWTRDIAGLHALNDRSGQPIFLLDPGTAAADPEGAERYKLLPMPKNGYYFRMMVTDQDGEAYQKEENKEGVRATHKTRYGVVAYPAAYGAGGRFTFITNEAGKTWKKDTQGKPVTRWPGKDPGADGWLLAE